VRDGFQGAVVRRQIAHGVLLLQGQAGLFVGAAPCARWFSGAVLRRHIAHGVLLLQGQAGLFVGAAPCARWFLRCEYPVKNGKVP